MHGVLLLDGRGEPVSRLITWQDGRCLEEGWLDGLVSRTGAVLRTGYGCATLAWLADHEGLPAGAASASTIHDWIAAGLSGSPRPVTDPTDAASWGLFRASALSWDEEAVRAAGIPREMLPRVVGSGCVVGRVPEEAAASFGVPAGAAVAAALGDNQASLVATLTEPEAELALTLGTGGQLSAVLPRSEPLLVEPGEAGFEYRPFPGGLFMAVAASLCGGSAWRWLASAVRDWLAELGQPRMPEDRAFEALNRAGEAAAGRLTVVPRFLGERYDPSLRGRIEGIGLDNFTLGNLARSLAEGIAANLRDMLPARLRAGRRRIRGSGNALVRNPLLRSAAERVFGLPLEMADLREEAAVGAALLAAGRLPGGPAALRSAGGRGPVL
jgi:sedoheptulokinase